MSPDAFVEALPLPGLLIGPDARIVAANAPAKDLLGEGLRGRHYVTMLRQPLLVDTIDKALRDPAPRDTRYLTNDGEQDVIYRVTCRQAGEAGVLVCFEDITPIEQAGQSRRDFVANVSHELRTPLTALIGFIETLRGPAKNDPEAQERFLTIMGAEAGRMNRLVDDLLSLSKVEGQERVRPTEQVLLQDVLSGVAHSLRPLAEAAGVAIELDIADAELRVSGDADQLAQVFTNLVENAIKYAGTGKRVTVRASFDSRDAFLRAPAARVSVIDYGEGIDPVHLPRLTERFYRADAHRSRELGGTGLGLAIVKHMVNRHRGRLRIESEPGQGSVFTVILPCLEQHNAA